jgi:predicted ATPase with chaperone activity
MISDFKLVKGQEAAKRAIEIAVTGGHAILLCGPSGCGKTTLAECARALAPSTNPVVVRDDIDLACDIRQLRRDLDEGGLVVATAADIPTDFSVVDRVSDGSDD